MISYQSAKEIIEILTSGVDFDTSNWIKLCDDESEAKNTTPETPEVEHIYIKYFEKGDQSSPLATIDIDAFSGVYISFSSSDFTQWGIGNVLKNFQSAHNYIKSKL